MFWIFCFFFLCLFFLFVLLLFCLSSPKIPFFLLWIMKKRSPRPFSNEEISSLFGFLWGQRVLHPLQIRYYLSRTSSIMFALTTQFAGVQVVSKTNAPKKSVNKVVSVSFKVFSRVVYPPLSRERWRRSLMNFLFFFHSPDGSSLRWMMNVRDEMISRCHLLY